MSSSGRDGPGRFIPRLAVALAAVAVTFTTYQMYKSLTDSPWKFHYVRIDQPVVTMDDVRAEAAVTLCKSGTWLRPVAKAVTYQSWTPVNDLGDPTGDTIPASTHAVKLPASPAGYPLLVSNCRSREPDGTPSLQLDSRMRPGRYVLAVETWAYPASALGLVYSISTADMRARAYLTVR